MPRACKVPHNIYMQIKYILCDYERMRGERSRLLSLGAGTGDGMPKGNLPANPTENKALKLMFLNDRIRAIEEACSWMKGRLKEQVAQDFDPVKAYFSYDYYNYKYIRVSPEDEGPARRTWNYFKTELSMQVMNRMHFF